MKELRFHGQAIVTGQGSVAYLKTWGIKRALIVTGGQSAAKNGMLDRVIAIIREGGGECAVVGGVPKNPPLETVRDGLKRLAEYQPDTVIGLGGGSAIDVAKIMALWADNPEADLAAAYRQGALPQARCRTRLVAIPGTSGTASEVTPFAVLTFRDENLKRGGKSAGLIPDLAILDVDMTLSMPPHVAAETGMDAMAHAVECYTNRALDDFTACLAEGAIEGLYRFLPGSCHTGSRAMREKVHNYQCMAGCAFANVGTGMDHGIAHAIGGKYDLGHGLVIAVALPYVLEFNSRDSMVRERLARLAGRLGVPDYIEAIRRLNAELGIPKSFRELGISEAAFAADFDGLVENSLQGSTRVNPVPVSREDMELILRRIYNG